jgi:hypothetical protein
MEKEHSITFYILVSIACIIGFFTLHALNKVPDNLPTIQQMQNVILEHQYGEAFLIIDFYPKTRKLHIWIDKPLTIGTDQNCEAFAQIIWKLMMLDSRLIIYVDGEWVPSRQNPIDYTWAKVLMEAGHY